jgi:hypothetical protein
MVVKPSDINSFTPEQMRASYVKSIIPPNINMDANGIIDKESLKTYVTSMLRERGISQPSFDVATKERLDEVTVFNEKMKVFFEDLKKEYDFYNSRYRYAIWTLINTLAIGAANEEAINAQKNIAKDLNKKLNIVIQITQGISDVAYSNANSNETQIQEMNTSLNEKAEIIKKHSTVLQKNMSNMDLRKQMVEYTQEKARATENLLSLYFVLNVFAIGALLYVYKAN